MDKDAVAKMGMSKENVTDMIAAWKTNQDAWRQALLDNSLFEWFLFYGGQQTAPGWSQTQPNTTCSSYMKTNCGPDTPPQNGTLFFGFSRVEHHQAWPLPSPDQDVAAFLLTRGPYAYMGYGWTGCANEDTPFTQPPALTTEYGSPTSTCREISPNVFQRDFAKATVSLNCTDFTASFVMKN
jgi:hypothetical protein